MAKHVSGTRRHDGNISYVQSEIVAEVAHVSNGKREVLFSSTNWEAVDEKYDEAIMLRDLSGFKDTATIRKHLEQIEEQYG
jgi:hypothetical protein